MKKKFSSKISILIFAFLYMNPSWAFGESIMNGMPDLTTARFNVVCSEIVEGKTQEGNFNQGLCIGIILGVEDNAHYDKKICVPQYIGIKERVQVVRSYITSQPNRMNEAFASLVFDAMSEKWPCSSK